MILYPYQWCRCYAQKFCSKFLDKDNQLSYFQNPLKPEPRKNRKPSWQSIGLSNADAHCSGAKQRTIMAINQVPIVSEPFFTNREINPTQEKHVRRGMHRLCKTIARHAQTKNHHGNQSGSSVDKLSQSASIACSRQSMTTSHVATVSIFEFSN